YPSLAHWLARQRQQRELLGEELRLLYVAMTRARDKLILAGSMPRTRWETLPATWPEITSRALLLARSCADWLRLWHAHHGKDADGLFRLRLLDDAELAGSERTGSTEATSGESFPAPDAATLEKLHATLAWEYPFASATARAAKSSVTALRRAAAEG